MDALEALIAEETAKLRILEQEVAARRQRIETLKSMQRGDDLDAALRGRLTPSAPVHGKPQFAGGGAAAGGAFPMFPDGASEESVPGRRKKGEVKRAMLATLHGGHKHLVEVQKEMAGLGYQLDGKRIRGEMWAYKQEGLITADGMGMYGLTEKGKAFVEGQKGETPGGAGVSGATVSVEDLL